MNQDTSKKDADKKRSWPNSRGIIQYARLHKPHVVTKPEPEPTVAELFKSPLAGGKSKESFLAKPAYAHVAQLLAGLPSNPTVVDLGMGNGQFLIDLAGLLGLEADLIGVSATPKEIKYRQCRIADIKIVKGALPDDDAIHNLLIEKREQVDRIFDSYGPCTYAKNPVHSLFIAALMLKPDGKFSAISSTNGKDFRTTVFGSLANRREIAAFFKKELGIAIRFRPNYINSMVNPGVVNQDMLITFEKTKSTNHINYVELCRKFDNAVGNPLAIGKEWYKYQDFKIQMYDYQTFSFWAKANPNLNVAKGNEAGSELGSGNNVIK
ncbi:hypothetical protein ACFORL_09045 [Legionella dresdenensis]|uniref:Methyltransferase n=1 Tax=Legionella dresdenensis TaxID=450200 RepID=A0ABV8CG94_9GAMM